ncbi:MAG TPA: GAF domain-containing protein [Burkholderiales bacterium]|nr:GAF domain-containing protein [Burkholderiales bacterium]
MAIPVVYAKALQRAAEILGGKRQLRERLRVPMSYLEAWMAGGEQPPMDVFLKTVDIISAAGAPENARYLANGVQNSRELRREAAVLRAAAQRTQERARAIYDSILAAQATAAPRPRSALGFLQQKFDPRDGRAMIESALDAAITVTHADKGNAQLVCPEGLRLVVQRGFDQAFVDFFALVTDQASACGRAISEGKRVVLADVAASPFIAGTPSAQVLQRARVRAVQSTPLFATSGELLGVLSTHYERPHAPSDGELDALDHVALRAAFWLEGGVLEATK